MFHEHKPKVDVFTFTIIIQFYMSILNTPTILGLLFNGCIQTAIGFFQTTQTHPWSDPDDAQIDSVLSAETLADLLSVLEPWMHWEEPSMKLQQNACEVEVFFIFADWDFAVVLDFVVVVVVVGDGRNIPQIALLDPVDSNLTRSFHNQYIVTWPTAVIMDEREP